MQMNGLGLGNIYGHLCISFASLIYLLCVHITLKQRYKGGVLGSTILTLYWDECSKVGMNKISHLSKRDQKVAHEITYNLKD